MATKAQIEKAVRAVLAAEKRKAPAKRKMNPAPRIGTKRPRRASQITGKAPTKRLVRRRKANAVEGYFPNPAEIGAAYRENLPYAVEESNGENPAIVARFMRKSDAVSYARDEGKKYALIIRVLKD